MILQSGAYPESENIGGILFSKAGRRYTFRSKSPTYNANVDYQLPTPPDASSTKTYSIITTQNLEEVTNHKVIDIGSFNSLDAFKTGVSNLAATYGSNSVVWFSFYPNFTYTPAGFYPASYGERYGVIIVRTSNIFICFTAWPVDGVVARFARNGDMWNVGKFTIS